MDVRLKPKLYIPGFALLTALVLTELAAGLSGEWIILTVLAWVGFLLLVLSSILRDLPSPRLPSPRPATWVFVMSYAVLAQYAVELYAGESRAHLIGVAVGAAGLGILWRGIRRNRRWAWNWTRCIYTILIGSLFVATALSPFIPGKFRRMYVSDFTGILTIPDFLIRLAILLVLFFMVRDALITPPDGGKSTLTTTGK